MKDMSGRALRLGDSVAWISVITDENGANLVAELGVLVDIRVDPSPTDTTGLMSLDPDRHESGTCIVAIAADNGTTFRIEIENAALLVIEVTE